MLCTQIIALILPLVTCCQSQCPQQVNASKQAIYNRLYNYLTGTGAHNFDEYVTLGFLGAYGDTEVTVGLGALPLAIDAVNADPNLLPGKRLTFVAADIGTNPRWPPLSLRVMTEMRDSGTVAFIGPDGTCISEALVAAAWNLPIISYRCADMAVSDKRVYHTFARTLPPSKSVSKSVVALLKAFSWDKFVIVSGQTAWAVQVKNAVRGFAKEHGMTVMSEWVFTDYIPMLKVKIDKIIADSYEKTRVYVFIGEHVALVDFVQCLQERKLLDVGDYIVISVDDQIYDPDNRANIVQRRYIDPWLNLGGSDTLLPFRSVLKLTPSHHRNPEYKWKSELKKHATRAGVRLIMSGSWIGSALTYVAHLKESRENEKITNEFCIKSKGDGDVCVFGPTRTLQSTSRGTVTIEQKHTRWFTPSSTVRILWASIRSVATSFRKQYLDKTAKQIIKGLDIHQSDLESTKIPGFLTIKTSSRT